MIRTLLALVLGLYLFIIGLVTYVAYSSLESSRESSRNHIALCALHENIHRSVLERRVKIQRTEDFLRGHPHGIPGIPAKLFRRGLRDDQATLKTSERNDRALYVLGC
jgi:hypothetical protein